MIRSVKVRVTAATSVALASLVALLGSSTADAIQGGSSASDMAPSVVRLTDAKGKELCTGSVAGDGWVLSAYHCYTTSDYNYGAIRIEIWRSGIVGKGEVWRSNVVATPLFQAGSTAPEASPPGNRDVMLLRAASPMPPWAKTIPMALSWPPMGATLTQYGYGRTSINGTPSNTLQKTPDGDLKRVNCSTVAAGYAWTAGHICAQGAVSTAWRGDSGGPLLWWTNGYWQQVGDFSAFPNGTKGVHWQAYWSEADVTTRSWISGIVTGPISAGTILRNAADGTAWLYGADGYRHWIPNGSIYECLASQGSPVESSWPLRRIETIPDMTGSTGWATCTPPPPPPPSSMKGFTIEDYFLGGTWARTDPYNGTWYSRSNPPPNGAYWYPNGLGVGVDCAKSAATYVVRFADGHTESWNTWFHVTDGKWYPSAASAEVFNNSFYGLPACP